ncbi:MAG TPA: beta-ketoacyl synthase N-terminal-like domain-containing protein [Anaeromyxobacter sp.]|nr:beta-ketoacyl synthase N-terminal-like domain-containing protein [Anaeromyxobacter sp.]
MSGAAGRHEVLVTGVGLHGAHGGGPATLAALRAGRSAVAPFRTPEADGFPEVAAAPAAPWALDDLVPDRKLQKYMSRAASLAVLAAGRALRDAGLLADAERKADVALFVATGLIGFELDQVTQAMSVSGEGLGGDRMARGLALCHPLMPFRMLLNMPLGLVSIAYGLRGENAILYPGPLQGGVALRMAFDAVASGRAPRALAGGSVHGLALMPLATAWRAGRLARSPEAAAHRDGAGGLAAADASAFVLLESRAAASARGARARAVLSDVRAEPQDGAPAPRRGPPPGLVLASGSVDARTDEADRGLAVEAGAPEAALLRVDPLAGHAGAAAPATAAALAALALAAPDGPARALAVARDPEGGAVLADLAAEARA